MRIVAHRGYWRTAKEKNKLSAFKRAFGSGFGVETDIRDHKGGLVISHDIAGDKCMNVEGLFRLHSKTEPDLPLALNIKADGLQVKLKKLLNKYKVKHYFVFDTSVPDAVDYLKLGMNVYGRQSEYETDPSFYREVKGIWIDCFKKEWVDETTIRGHLKKRKKVCLVSPELHKRKYMPFWRKLSMMKVIKDPNLMLCTDHPEEAGRFFNEKN